MIDALRCLPVTVTAIVSKLDEAEQLGECLSALIRAEIPIAYGCYGRRVLEDLRPASSLDLIAAATEARNMHLTLRTETELGAMLLGQGR